MKVIAVDFDDVILPFSQGFVAYHNEKHATNVTYDGWYTWEMHEVFGCNPSTMTERVTAYLMTPEHDLLHPLPGSLESLGKISNTHQLEIITSRPYATKERMASWLEKHFPKIFKGVHFTNNFAPETGQIKRPKSEVCIEIGAKLLIEDSLMHAEDVIKTGIPVLLPDRPWNRSHTPEGVTRVKDWDEIVKWVEEKL